MESKLAELEYAGFWPRAGAMVLDLVIVAPIALVVHWLLPPGSAHPVLVIAPHVVFSCLYSVYVVYRFGGTPGKLIMRLRITSLDGMPVTFPQALLREAPGLLLGAMVSAGFAIAAWRIGLTVPMLADRETVRQVEAAAPAWSRFLVVVEQIWIWSELIVMLTNRRRRALHDFIAGTVVIRHPAHGFVVSEVSLPSPR